MAGVRQNKEAGKKFFTLLAGYDFTPAGVDGKVRNLEVRNFLQGYLEAAHDLGALPRMLEEVANLINNRFEAQGEWNSGSKMAYRQMLMIFEDLLLPYDIGLQKLGVLQI